jgi:histidine kinase
MTGVQFGCDLAQVIYCGQRSVLYRGRRIIDGVPVLVKTARDEATDPGYGQRLRHDHDMRVRLGSSSHIVRSLAIEADSGRLGLILEDVGLDSVTRLTSARQPTITEFFGFAKALSTALAAIHERGVAHGRVCSDHILTNERLSDVRLVDFTSAVLAAQPSVLPSEPPSLRQLAFRAPEHMRRSSSAATAGGDLFSLGVALYQFVTGVLPFEGTDSLELSHAISAGQPPTIASLRREVPEFACNIIHRLLKKNPDERYRSAQAVSVDLALARDAFQRGHTPDVTLLGKADAEDRPAFPDRLYGRAEPLQTLEAILSRPHEGNAVVVTLAGPAGVGKSRLVAELTKRVNAKGTVFASAKFEQYEDSLPFVMLGQALNRACLNLFAAGEAAADWRSRVSLLLPRWGSVLLDLCPALGQLSGAAPPPATLAPNEARLRATRALALLVGSFGTSARPVCLFFDDVQWASAEALRWVAELGLSLEGTPAILLLAFRDDEPGGAESVVSRIAASGLGAPVHNLTLAPLPESDVRALSAATFELAPAANDELARVVYSRTRGNPFFVRTFIHSLVADGLIRRDALAHHVDLPAVWKRGVTDNVVDLLVARIERLSPVSRAALRLAACHGNPFDAATLGAIQGKDVHHELAELAEAELVIRLDESSEASPRVFGIAHDKVQQALLDMLEPEVLDALHLAIGRHAAQRFDAGAPDSELFRACAHLNRVVAALSGSDERRSLAERNLLAARHALCRGLAGEAATLARAGLQALGGEAPEEVTALVQGLGFAALESALATSDYEALDTFARQILAASCSPLEIARVNILRGRARYGQHRLTDAIEFYTTALCHLGIGIDASPDSARVAEEVRKTADRMRGFAPAALIELPSCTDHERSAAMDCLSQLILVLGSAASPAFPLAVCRLVQLSLAHGNSAASACGYTFYGLLMSQAGDYELAYQMGQVALAVCNQREDPAALAQTALFANFQLSHWKTPLADLSNEFRVAHQYALAAGSPYEAANTATTLCICRFFAGDDLVAVEREALAFRPVIVRFRQDLVLNWHEILLQTIANLRSADPAPWCLKGAFYDEATRLPVHRAAGDGSALFNYNLATSFLGYLFGERELALSRVEDNEPFLPLFSTGYFALPVLYIDSLVRLAQAASLDDGKRTVLLARVQNNLERLTELREHNPRGVGPKLETVRAELLRLTGDHGGAQAAYARAINLARSLGSGYEQAIACELAARYYQGLRDGTAMRAHMRAAHRAYSQWGATAKARALERAHPFLMPRTGAERAELDSPLPGELDVLDVVSVLHVTRAMSGERDVSRLLTMLMRVLLESAGASVGYLLMMDAGEWRAEVALVEDRGIITMLQSLRLGELKGLGCGGVSEHIVQHVSQTRRAVIVDDASDPGQFEDDLHFAARQTGSIACFPLEHQGNVVAIAYLENPLLRRAFTPASLQVLQMISTHAVVSLENARLYASLEARVETRTRELSAKNAELRSSLARNLELQRQLVLQEKLAGLGAIAAGVAHEIKNPLNFVMNFADVSVSLGDELEALLRGGAALDRKLQGEVNPIVADLRSALRKIGEHGSRATKIINGMALHTRGGSTPREWTDLNALLTSCIGLVFDGGGGPRAPGIRLSTCYDEGLGEIEVAAQDLSRVFVNVMTNARYAVEQKASRAPATYTPMISVETRRRDEQVEVAIRDNGEGIPEAALEKIFEPFFTTKAPGQGTGLGLSISHDIIVRGHGGELLANSAHGAFAEFVIRLPRPRRLAAQ